MPPYPHERGVPPPPKGRPRGGSGEKEPEPALAPPCPMRGPEAGRPHTRAQYFKPLSRAILQYVNHPEYKYEGNVGLLTRRKINVHWILIIDKEANKIEDQPLFITDA